MATIKKPNLGAIAVAPRTGLLPAAVGPAALSLDITEFNAVTTGKYCQAVLSPTGNIGPVTVAGNVIRVKAKCDIAIAITSSIGIYIPVGIALIQVSNPAAGGNPNDPQGYVNFANIAWTGTILQFTNHWKYKGQHGSTAPIWKMYVLVADLGTQPPTLGIIDPDIENQN
jgi:hypothetical protein